MGLNVTLTEYNQLRFECEASFDACMLLGLLMGETALSASQ